MRKKDEKRQHHNAPYHTSSISQGISPLMHKKFPFGIVELYAKETWHDTKFAHLKLFHKLTLEPRNTHLVTVRDQQVVYVYT